jgi:hypothetical protein
MIGPFVSYIVPGGHRVTLSPREIHVGAYRIVFSKIVFEEHDDNREIYGVKFFHNGFVYDVLCNLHMGERLLITQEPATGYLRDMPFHLGTARFLPECVKVTRR